MEAVECYQKAAFEAGLKEKAGKKILLQAVNDKYNREKFKKIGAGILGQEFVDEVFPGEKTITVFEKTYTWDDAFEKSMAK